MDGFSFEVVGDAGKADKAIDGVLDRLDRIAPRAKQASSELTTAFQRAATLVEQYNRALERGTGVKFADSVRENAEALRAQIEQLQREKDALDAIRGPVQQYQNELQALTQLLGKGAISAQEFNTRLAEIRPPTAFKAAAAGGGGGFNLSSLASSLPGGSIIAGAAGGGVAGAAMAGAQMAISSAGEIIKMSDAYTSLDNRLKALTGSQQGAKDLFDKIAASASHTRSDLETTASAVISITMATKELGLSQAQVMSFTEHLNEDIAMSGASASEAAGGMIQLTQALSIGKLQGQDLKALIQNTPIVAQRIAEGMGISFGKLRELAEEGKVTAAQIIAAYEKTGPEIDRAFGKSVPTIAQQFTLLRNEAFKAVGEISKDANVTQAFADSAAVLGDVIKATADQVAILNKGLGEMGLSLGDVLAGSGGGLKAVGGFFANMDVSVDGLKNALLGIHPAAKHYAEQQDVINRVVAMGTGHMNDYAAAQAENTIRLTLGDKAADEFANKMENVSAATERAQAVVKAFQDTFGEVTVGINQASHALGELGNVLADNAQTRSYNIIGARAADVHNAKIQLDALNIAFKEGSYPAGLYREEAKRLKDVIDGVSSASRTAGKEIDALGKKLLRGESPSDRAIRSDAADRAQQLAERNYLTDLDQKGEFDDSGSRTGAAVKYRLEIEQLDDIDKRHNATEEEHAERVRVVRDEWLKTIGVFDAVYGKLDAEDQQMVKLNEALQVGALNAYEYARAVSQIEGAAARKNAEEQRKKYDKATSGYAEMQKEADDIAKKQGEAAQKTREQWANALTDVGMNFIDAAAQGKLSWESWGESAAAAIEKAIIKMVLLKAIQAAIGGPAGAAAGAGGGSGFGDMLLGALTGHADGTQFMVGGRGGTDQNIVAFRASNDERVTVETANDRASGKYFGGGGGGDIHIKPTFKVVMPPERTDIVDTSRQGMTNFVELQRQTKRRSR